MLSTRPVLVVWGMHRLFEATPRFEISPVHCLHGCQLNFPKEQAILSDDSSQAVESRNLGAEGKKCKVRFSLVLLTPDECNAGRLISIRIERIFICLRSVTPTAIWDSSTIAYPSVSLSFCKLAPAPATIHLLAFWMQFLPISLKIVLYMHIIYLKNTLHTISYIIHTSVRACPFLQLHLPQESST